MKFDNPLATFQHMGGSFLIHIFMFAYSLRTYITKVNNLTNCTSEEKQQFLDIFIMIWSHLISFLSEITEKYIDKSSNYGTYFTTSIIAIHSTTYMSAFMYLTFKF